MSRKTILKKMKPAMICTLFDNNLDNLASFSHKQIQVMALSDKLGLPIWSKKEVEYFCSFEKQVNYDASKPTAIIPIRDCSNIITMCMESMKKTNTFELINVIIVDDRSVEDIKGIAQNYGVSYLRVDYDSTFNFSMLCNIAAKVCNDLGNTQVIMWNADLYIADRVNLENLLKKHDEAKSTLSGAKLLYPPLEYSTINKDDTKNILKHFPQMAGKWRNTIQFGNGVYHNGMPMHAHRFQNRENNSIDCLSNFITGAFQLIQLDKFTAYGGYNPSLEKSFQDVDLSKNISGDVWYFGTTCFYHDESPVFNSHNTKTGEQFHSDAMLYNMLKVIPDQKNIKMLNSLKNKHIGETCYILGKGESIRNLSEDDLGIGFILALYETIDVVEKLDIKNKIYSLQKDTLTNPNTNNTIFAHKHESAKIITEVDDRHVVFDNEQLGLQWNSPSITSAINIAKYLGCSNICMVSFDASTNGNVKNMYGSDKFAPSYRSDLQRIQPLIKDINIKWITPTK